MSAEVSALQPTIMAIPPPPPPASELPPPNIPAPGVTPAAAAAAAGAAAAAALRDPSRLPSVLTSDVHNEAELIFSMLQDRDRLTVSHLDVLTLLRGMGMNPVATDMDYLREVMREPIEILEAAYREEEARKEKERRREEEKKGRKPAPVRKPDPKKGKPGTAEGKDGEGAEGKDGKKKPLSQPQEEVKNIDWNIFISAVEPIFRDNHLEQDEILAALKVFDVEGTGTISRAKLIEIVTQNGESVLSPAEVKQVNELLPEDMTMVEFAQRVQGTYVPPTQAEIEAREAEERRLREERIAKEKAAAAAADPLAALLGTTGDSAPPAAPAEGASTAA